LLPEGFGFSHEFGHEIGQPLQPESVINELTKDQSLALTFHNLFKVFKQQLSLCTFT